MNVRTYGHARICTRNCQPASVRVRELHLSGFCSLMSEKFLPISLPEEIVRCRGIELRDNLRGLLDSSIRPPSSKPLHHGAAAAAAECRRQSARRTSFFLPPAPSGNDVWRNRMDGWNFNEREERQGERKRKTMMNSFYPSFESQARTKNILKRTCYPQAVKPYFILT